MKKSNVPEFLDICLVVSNGYCPVSRSVDKFNPEETITWKWTLVTGQTSVFSIDTDYWLSHQFFLSARSTMRTKIFIKIDVVNHVPLSNDLFPRSTMLIENFILDEQSAMPQSEFCFVEGFPFFNKANFSMAKGGGRRGRNNWGCRGRSSVVNCANQDFSKTEHFDDSPCEHYEHITPYRSSSNGDYISYNLSTEKEEKYREYLMFANNHPDYDIPTNFPKNSSSSIFYTFSAFGEQFVLNVSLSSHLVAPNTSIEKHLDNGTISTNSVQKKCFYQGIVNNSYNSIVSINNCNIGLNGWIQWKNEDFLITFSESHVHSNGSNGLVHVICKTNKLDSKVNLVQDNLYSKEPYKILEEFRSKRSTHFERPYFVETLVAVDSSMYAFHRAIDVETYVIQLINMVNQLFNHPSLNSKVTLVVIKIIYLNERQSTEIETSGSRDSSFQSVALLAQNVSKSSTRNPDLTAFIIRKTLLVAGLSMTNSMCKSGISCAVVRDDGLLQTAFVIAHEVGHMLGMIHDNDIEDCKKDAEKSSVMSSLVKAHSGYYWSECSLRAFKDNIESKFCLLDSPFEVLDKKASQMLPGELYSRDQQCYFNHGEDYRHCVVENKEIDCRYLRCGADFMYPTCLSQRRAKPPLPGTFCKTDHWCINGSCIHINYQDGGWSKWTAWTVCSRVCGIGVSKRRRYCDKPRAQFGGKKCEGKSFEYKLCNTQDCGNPIQDPRADKCKDNLSNWLHEGEPHSWVPSELLNRSLSCKLSCVSLNTKSVVVTDQNVIDGVACSYENPHGICIEGRCVRIGCDKVLGSKVEIDRCGVCGGNNSTCREIDSSKRRRLKRTYQVALKIPIGAYDIRVQEVTKSNHFLALKDDLHRRYILNSKSTQGPSCEFVYHRVSFVYINEDGLEILKARGPMRSNLTVLLGKGSDKGPIIVHYSYVINRNKLIKQISHKTKNIEKRLYHWRDKGWTVCSKSCGNGTSIKMFDCIENGTDRVVDKFFCISNGHFLTPVSRVCNERDCIVAQWRTYNWSECSETCGLSSYKRRWVDCVMEENGVNETVPIRLCKGERPDISKLCNVSLCVGKWKRSEWSQCSVSCEKGVQTRKITCVARDGKPNPDYGCDIKDKNRSTKPCDMGPCVCNPKAGGKICSLRTYQQYCKLTIYREQCCSTCLKQRLLLEDMIKASKVAKTNQNASQKLDKEAKRAKQNRRNTG
ncbi:A disintegrin and metalloproteinase with thrombospondin motifs 3-like [Antedon mediterranea]|uniref:A disintegrin and metalloproteinase with thrombospondin motifs 3-like n=1 Tax=Antedon mediterranea TaxID=105859 RepID=UPI003AF6E122